MCQLGDGMASVTFVPRADGSSGRKVVWLSPREQVDWQAFIQMQELLRSRLEQGLVSRSGLSNADYTVLAVCNPNCCS